MITNFKQFNENLSVNENLLVPRNLEGRKEKRKTDEHQIAFSGSDRWRFRT